MGIGLRCRSCSLCANPSPLDSCLPCTSIEPPCRAGVGALIRSINGASSSARRWQGRAELLDRGAARKCERLEVLAAHSEASRQVLGEVMHDALEIKSSIHQCHCLYSSVVRFWRERALQARGGFFVRTSVPPL